MGRTAVTAGSVTLHLSSLSSVNMSKSKGTQWLGEEVLKLNQASTPTMKRSHRQAFIENTGSTYQPKRSLQTATSSQRARS